MFVVERYIKMISHEMTTQYEGPFLARKSCIRRLKLPVIVANNPAHQFMKKLGVKSPLSAHIGVVVIQSRDTSLRSTSFMYEYRFYIRSTFTYFTSVTNTRILP